ncbi:hypothetical protein [Hyphomonas johnsonii]|jgi:hypothetical protein|uniref:Uncharacterized protein n=1 Tax=Hyphomonas johnsonii MHS-2 TaxID=1280950 RepID=A0A059FMD3_9PROT|nr:hypothetical protein [Hyphomonas johnsonii]KCZ91608.1 hypothetical protein HJO_10842 [Hyphomonas johnsonii MHS-2]
MALNPNYSAVSGRQHVTGNWALTLPGEFNRREEQAGLCFWRPGLTVWLTAYGVEDGMSIDDRMARDKANASPEASEISESVGGGVARLSYRLSETRGDGARVQGLYAFAHGAEGQVMVAAYFDDETDLDAARQIGASLEYLGA